MRRMLQNIDNIVWVTKTIKLRVLTVTTNSGDTLYLYLTF